MSVSRSPDTELGYRQTVVSGGRIEYNTRRQRDRYEVGNLRVRSRGRGHTGPFVSVEHPGPRQVYYSVADRGKEARVATWSYEREDTVHYTRSRVRVFSVFSLRGRQDTSSVLHEDRYLPESTNK